MRVILCLTLLLAVLPAVAKEAEPLPYTKMIPGSIAPIIPNRGLSRKIVEDQLIPEWQFKAHLDAHQESLGHINQYLHYDLKAQKDYSDSAAFGFRENRNKKKITIEVDLAAQKAYLTSTDPEIKPREMDVRTGRPGFLTERFVGCYEIKSTQVVRYSREYRGAAMPNASGVVVSRGIYFHTGEMGSRSHGCMRMHPKDSFHLRDLFNSTMKDVGAGKKIFDAEICIRRTLKKQAPAAVADRTKKPVAAKPVVAQDAPVVAASASKPKPQLRPQPRSAPKTWYDQMFEVNRSMR